MPNGITRREALSAPAFFLQRGNRPRPNIVLLITDDQGYGDLSITGNPVLKTPNLDRIAREGASFQQFRVSPVCSPTRSSLLTGRWNYRTGIVDTYLGRSMMRTDEVTMAECLLQAGYATGIFGKWHLGDNAPLRAMDRGFSEALTLRGGGLAQPSSPPGTGYFDPPLEHNGRPVQPKGYCTDIFFHAAMDFIEQNRQRPFFCYLATNAPHTPLEIGDEWVAPYRGRRLDATTEKIYGMVANIDHNTGLLLAHLRRLRLDTNTILLYLSDNGPQQKRYNAGLRGLKGSVYEGGIRVPCFVRWPGVITAGSRVAGAAAHIDLMPTFLEACGASAPGNRTLDGRSLLARLSGQEGASSLPHFLQWHRGDAPEAWRNCAVLDGGWKLLDGKELYHLPSDPGEQSDVAGREPERVRALRASYERWFASVGAAGFDPLRIWIGSDRENPVLLTRQDWRGPHASWNADGLGFYEVDVRRPGRYQVELRFPTLQQGAVAVFDSGDVRASVAAAPGASRALVDVAFPSTGPRRFEGRLEFGPGRSVGAHYIQVRREE
jgi:arylsulfatase A-like enzyme